ncbi:hypothetical protein [uncultured Nocardioides sp.]|uniref:hypothetical protein n=1 Tax=uncultured Nocardioides sp. TaxID=198441 RepID=UPI00260A555D|nr:hypothetical protein [uncultured Nocardioides sp.]
MTSTQHAPDPPASPAKRERLGPKHLPADLRAQRRRWDPDLPLVAHALGLVLSIQLDDRDTARAEADALLDALAIADQVIPHLSPHEEAAS